jgi:hypothetical protein
MGKKIAIIFNILICLFLFNVKKVSSQTISSVLPVKIDSKSKFVFYLHGRIVEDQGANAVSSVYGPYEYNKILEALKNKGFNVISEVRPKDTDPEKYILKVSAQIDSLINAKVPPGNITVIGASKGGFMTILLSSLLNNENVNYVIMGICNDMEFNIIDGKGIKLCGNILSIYEGSDKNGGSSCTKFFVAAKCLNNYKEIRLNMGNAHGFLFKPFPEWINPASDWANQNYK